jgi:hypothetical protein
MNHERLFEKGMKISIIHLDLGIGTEVSNAI